MSEPFLGEIRMGGWNFAPNGWALCNGQLLAINQNTALFSLLGTTYGGDGVQNFQLPNLQGRVAIHWGNGPGLSPYAIGQVGGSENVTLLANQMPQHTHQAKCHSEAGNSKDPTNNIWSKDAGVSSAVFSNAAADGNMAPAAIAVAGGNQPHSNIQPYLCVTFVIAMLGIFPSRA